MHDRSIFHASLHVAVVYLLVAALWIAFSDQAVMLLVEDAEAVTRWQTYKGWAFVTGSSALIFWLCRRALARVSELDARLETAFEASPDPMALTRLADGAVEYANEAFRELFVKEADAAEGKNTLDIGLWADPEDREAFRQSLERDGVVRNQQVPMVTADGEVVPFLFSSRAIRVEDSDPRIISVARDVSDLEDTRHRLRQQLSRLRALRDIDMAITASLDVRVTLKVALDQVISLLEVDAADILLVEGGTQALTYGAGRGFRTDALRYTALEFGEGHAGRAARNQEAVEIPDLREEPGEFAPSGKFDQEGFVRYMALPLIAHGDTNGVLEVFHRTEFEPDREWRDFLEAIAGQAAIAIDNASLIEDLRESNQRLREAYDATIAGWARALELRDRETMGHTERVTEITVRLAREYGIPQADLVHVRWGSLLHDIGKMGVPDHILRKPGPLDDEEWEVMERHPVHAHELLSPISHLRSALDIPYCHHEKWDGSGYPRGLEGEQIPIAARIFAVVDVWDALRSDRPYRDAWPEDEVLEHLREESGSHFDPDVLTVFLDLHESLDLEEMRTEG